MDLFGTDGYLIRYEDMCGLAAVDTRILRGSLGDVTRDTARPSFAPGGLRSREKDLERHARNPARRVRSQ